MRSIIILGSFVYISSSIQAQIKLPESVLQGDPKNIRPLPPSKSFDANRLQLKVTSGKHQLVSNDVILKDFGPYASEANTAFAILADWGVNRRFIIPHSQPPIEVWTVDGEVPSRAPSRRQAISFDVNTLRVDKILEQYCLRDAQQVLVQFGTEQEAAKNALAWFKTLKINSIGFVGAPNPLMTYVYFDTFQSKGNKQGTNDPLQVVSQIQSQGLLIPRQNTGERKVELVGQKYRVHSRQIQIQRLGNQVELSVGNITVGRFGRDEFAARDSQRFLEDSRIDEIVTIGEQVIFFSRAQPLRYVPLQAPVTKLNLQQLRIEGNAEGEQWLMDGKKTLFKVGMDQTDAERFLLALQYYRIDSMGHFGNPLSGGMRVFYRKS
jgi:hypothetical protein